MEEDIKKSLEHDLGEKIVNIPYGSGVMETMSGKRFFIKRGGRSCIYGCEANGLAELSKAKGVNLPGVIVWGDNYIVTEYIERSRGRDGFYTRLGGMVAELHRVTGKKFGFYEDNFIGATPQSNMAEGKEAREWAEFYFNRRLLFQVRLAREKGYGREFTRARMEKLENRTYSMLDGINEPPSLLHGDLWGGNYLCGPDNTPYLIDPAVYYGHRETDIAMTMLFGGFPEEFYTAYDKMYPLPQGWRSRIPLYQLYHVLNHLNLFGGGYLGQALNIIDRL